MIILDKLGVTSVYLASRLNIDIECGNNFRCRRFIQLPAQAGRSRLLTRIPKAASSARRAKVPTARKADLRCAESVVGYVATWR